MLKLLKVIQLIKKTVRAVTFIVCLHVVSSNQIRNATKCSQVNGEAFCFPRYADMTGMHNTAQLLTVRPVKVKPAESETVGGGEESEKSSFWLF